MKVLFAVSNDNITTSVVNKYQQKYKEIVTSKNVYYFNAIVKELQNDKYYDAIVIEEDLEPISNNNYEAIDKFLFEKLDSISDEASKPTGEDIPIIFLCSDRRTKSDQLLRRLFSMSIYNALVGNDRSLDKLCELLNKPRNKKDAKRYYQIEGDTVEYQSQREELVSEDQIQNILNYFKKIGNNERKCVQAFDSISRQYNNTQLRLIVKILPMDVKAILETHSTIYQRLMSNGTVLSNGQYSPYRPNNPKRPEKLEFSTRNVGGTESRLDKPVVIPTNMDIQGIDAQNSNNTNNTQNNTNRMQQYNNNPYRYNQQYSQYRQYGPYGQRSYAQQINNPYATRPSTYPGYNNQQTTSYGMNNQQGYANTQQNIPYYNQFGSNQQSNNTQQTQQTQQAQQTQQNNETNKNEKETSTIDSTPLTENNTSNVTNTTSTNNASTTNANTTNASNTDINNNNTQNDETNTTDTNFNSSATATALQIEEIKPVEIKAVDPTPVKDIIKTAEEDDGTVVEPVKRGRGRPRKLKVSEDGLPSVNEIVSENKRRRGRPPKKISKAVSTIEDNGDNADNTDITNDSTSTELVEKPTDTSILNVNTDTNADVNTNINTENTDLLSTTTDGINSVNNNTTTINNNTNSNIATNNETSNTLNTSNLNTEAGAFDRSNNNSNNYFNNSINDSINNSNSDLFNSSANNTDMFNLGSNTISSSTDIKTDEYKPQTDSVKPINLYDLDINNDDFMNINSSVSADSNLGIKTVENKDDDYKDYLKEPIAGRGKITAFVGTSKNGTSFIINNIALMLAQSGINTAIVDLTKNKNSYYMFTDNDANKTRIATESLKKLSDGIVEGLNVKGNLTVFTALPEDVSTNELDNRKVLESLSNRFDIILLDCDFKTDFAYFAYANEIYLIQSMDALTIQPLTKFLSDLKLKEILDEDKLRIVINKYIKIKKLDTKMIVGGMSKYNEPSMTLQRDLFDPKKIKVLTIPFDNNTYLKYLESIALCQLSLNGYSKEVLESLEKLRNMVYPLVAGGNRDYGNGFDNQQFNNSNMYNNQGDSQQFSSSINDTLNKMRTNNY